MWRPWWFYEMVVGTKEIYLDERMRHTMGISPEEEHRARDFWLEHIHPDDRENEVKSQALHLDYE